MQRFLNCAGQFEESVNLNVKMNRMKQTDFDQKPEFLDQNGPAPALRLNFRNAPLRTVLNYLCDAADLSIEVERNVEVERTINLWNEELLSKEDSLIMLQQALSEEGYIAIHKGGVVAILRGQDAKKYRIPLPTLAYSAAE